MIYIEIVPSPFGDSTVLSSVQMTISSPQFGKFRRAFAVSAGKQAVLLLLHRRPQRKHANECPR